MAAAIEGYGFDRARFPVSGHQFRPADIVHWVALGTAAEALLDAGHPEGEGLPRETTGVFIGNTLTGDSSRASLMRLRWPYVRRLVETELIQRGWAAAQRTPLLSDLETRYKQPFAPVGVETLARGGQVSYGKARLRCYSYWRIGTGGEEELIARGEQQIACMRLGDHGLQLYRCHMRCGKESNYMRTSYMRTRLAVSGYIHRCVA